MECFNDLISLSPYCGLPKPKSGLYLSHLPGFSTELADKIANSEQVNFKGLWDAVQADALTELKGEFTSLLSERGEWKSKIYSTASPMLSGISLPGAIEKRGAYIQLPKHKMVGVYIKSIWIWAESEFTTTIYFKDLDMLTTKPLKENVALVAGLNKIEIEQEFVNNFLNSKFFVYIDGDSVNTRIFTEETYSDTLTYLHYPCSPCHYQFDEYYIAPAVDNGQLIKENEGRGIWLDAEFRCSVDALLCEYRMQIASAFRYLLAAKMLEQKLFSPRLNIFAVSNLEYTKENMNKLYGQFRSSLKKVVTGMDLSGVCFSCEESYVVTSRGMMP